MSCTLGKTIIRLLLRYSQAQTSASVAGRTNFNPSVMPHIRLRLGWIRHCQISFKHKLIKYLRAPLRSSNKIKQENLSICYFLGCIYKWVCLWLCLKLRLQAIISILEEGKSLVKKQYSKLLKLHKPIGSFKEKMQE